MSKFVDWLKVFFMITPTNYVEGVDGVPIALQYQDYTGPGFNRYKQSALFVKTGGIRRPGITLTKAEVVGYSEIPKVVLLVGIALLIAVAAWMDYIFVRVITFAATNLAVWAYSLTFIAMFTFISISAYPRVIFILKNFKSPQI